MARYRHIIAKKISLADLNPEPRVRKLTPRQKAQAERDEEIRMVINEAAGILPSEAIVIELKSDQKLQTIRAAVARLLAQEPRDINFGVRGNLLVFSPSAIPGGRGRARAKR